MIQETSNLTQLLDPHGYNFFKGGVIMSQSSRKLSRRKFIAAGSAAIAAPIVMNMTGKVVQAKAAENTVGTSAEKKGFFINDDCICCERCMNVCPQKAISFDGDIYVIDNQKCIQCRTCIGVCNMDAIIDPSAKPPVHEPHPIIRRDCDFLVLGGGTSGLIAAAIAAEVSGKKVILLEKAKKPGGSGMYAGGVRLWSTKWQLDAGVPDQMDDYIRSAMNVTCWELNPLLVANSFRSIPAFFDWFCTWGKAEEIFKMSESRLSKARKSIEVINKDGMKMTPFIKRLIDRCTSKGVEILTEYTATEFIMGDRGEISGVKAKDPGGTTIFNCKYCLVSTGNVINCGPLMERCCPDYAQALVRRVGHRLPSNTGDGVVMAEKAGIPIDYESIAVTYIGILQDPFAGFSTSGEARGDALFININGKRFVNETFADGAYSDFTWIIRRQPKNTFYLVMDSKVLTAEPLPRVTVNTSGNKGGRNVESGVPDPNANESTANTSVQGMSGMGREKISPEDLKKIASMSGRHVVIADTIEELEDKLGIDRKTLVATVKRYNELCAKGHDDDYFKPAKYMLPVEKGPFYALNYFLAMDGAVGGLAINENMQVMGHDGPVKGLYAAGDTTGCRYINRAGERIEIVNDMTWAVASGFLAGQNIGKQLKAV
jgi:fumarate reductase flavoprotein subunit